MPKISTVAADKPFAERLPAAFAYPLRGAALASCVALALAHYIGLLPTLLGTIGTLAVWAATWRYASDCMLHTANGFADPPDVSLGGNESSGWALVAIHFLLAALCVVSAVFFPHALWPILLGSALILPAIDMTLAFEGNLADALNPLQIFRVMAGFGVAYLIPVAINLIVAVLIVLAAAATGALPRLLALPLYSFAYTYLIVLGFHLMGAMIHERHEQFGMAPEAHRLVADSGQDEDTLLLAAVQERAAEQPRAAIDMLVARLQDRSAPAPLHLAYRQLLRQEGLRDALLVHGQIWTAALLANNEGKRALGLVQECMELDPAFLPDDPATAGPLAELAARMGMSRLAVKLCQGYLSKWARTPEAPRIGLLAAQQLGLRLDQPAEALVLVRKLIAAFPDHPVHADLLALERQLLDTPQTR
ncbi:hypothetical protein [Dyella sp. 2RAB6]|uniref:hypothetical protein n=1 Tax=Dyella sp. 2RAB6 TaxID=3232992 RepID=UPI003F92FBC6